MKIAFLSFYSGLIYRGAEIFVHELGNRLVLLGHEVTVYQSGQKLSGAKYKTITIKVQIDHKRNGSYTPLFNYYGLKVKEFTHKALGQIEARTDIVIPTNGQWQGILCRIWTFIHAKKVVITGHSGLGADDKLNLLTFPDVFVGLSEHQLEWAKKVNPLVPAVEIPNGVDLDKFSPAVKPYNFKLKNPIILCVSALSYWKRLDLVVKAVSRLGNASLVIVGSEQKGDKTGINLEKLARKLLPGRFKIVSFKHEDMPGVYSAADVFTYSTVPWESFGLVLLEAMAANLPVVVTDDPIRRYIVGNAGVLVDPTDTSAFVSALEHALKTNWGDKPRRQAEKFDWALVAGKYDKLFRSLVK